MTTALSPVEWHSIEELIKAEVAKQVAAARKEIMSETAAEIGRLNARITRITGSHEGLP